MHIVANSNKINSNRKYELNNITPFDTVGLHRDDENIDLLLVHSVLNNAYIYYFYRTYLESY